MKKILVLSAVAALVAGMFAAVPAGAASSAGTREPQVEPTPGHQDPPGKKKGCNKGKGKKKGCHKTKNPKSNGKNPPKPADSCKPFRPGEMGAEADTVRVRDSHTSGSSHLYTIDQPAGVSTGLPTDELTGAESYLNIKVDTAKSAVGLWVYLEFADGRDYDLYLHDAKGNEVASAHGFNPMLELSGENQGGESGPNWERLSGIRTPACGGYTLRVVTAHGEGGEMPVRFWLGGINYDPRSQK